MVTPTHELEINFKRYNKKFLVNVKIFKTNKQLNDYYDKDAPGIKYPSVTGIIAATIFDEPLKENKNYLGEVVFSLENLNPSLIAHEMTHIVFNYFQYTHGLDFSTRRKEETFCSVLEELMNGVFENIRKLKLEYTILPRWKMA